MSPLDRVRRLGRHWWVRSFGSLERFPTAFATKREALARAVANEAFVKEFNGAKDADELAILESLAPKPKKVRRVKLSRILAELPAPPGGWTPGDHIER